ncbi:MAG: cobaltochelatase subunit CobN [Cytophagales bacterium]|nr:cobaltochelatase subunit CobN [Cytophagales bacterium]
MHRIATIPGGWNPGGEGVMYIDQSPGDIVFLSAADTELHLLNEVYTSLCKEKKLPGLRMVNLLYLKQEYTIDTYAEEVLSKAKVIVANLLGGYAYYPYLVEVLQELSDAESIPLILLPGYAPDVDTMSRSTADLDFVQKLWQYVRAGGQNNFNGFLKLLLNKYFDFDFSVTSISELPRMFVWSHEAGIFDVSRQNPDCLIIAYKTHYLSDNLEAIKSLQVSLSAKKLTSAVVFVDNLRDIHAQDELYEIMERTGIEKLSACINTTSFSLKNAVEENDRPFIFDKLNVPVIQAIQASVSEEVWRDGLFGLSPTDIAMNIALPEVDGRIITRPISFKSAENKDSITDSEVSHYVPFAPGIEFVSGLTSKWKELQRKANKDKRIAVILPNYPAKNSRIANGVGLDTPASALRLLEALQDRGYNLGEQVPASTEALIELLTSQITNNPDTVDIRPENIAIDERDFQPFVAGLTNTTHETIANNWGDYTQDPFYKDGKILLPGLLMGNIYLGIQPSRGFNLDPKAIYHAPDLPPPWSYLAFYHWLLRIYAADAVIHLGKHGNLEWLPGKSIALDKEKCFPALAFEAVPNFYPFIVNDPGEGTQAKRRIHSIIIDHLIPPMTRAESYGDYIQLENLIDEYYQASNLDARRAEAIKNKVEEIAGNNHLEEDFDYENIDDLLMKLDAYLCELKEAQIRGGLHILGACVPGDRLAELIVALHRLPQMGNPGITQALAMDLSLGFDPLHCDMSASCGLDVDGEPCRSYGKAVEALEAKAVALVRSVMDGEYRPGELHNADSLLRIIGMQTLPSLDGTKDELSNLLRGLDGKYVPSGASGAPTRGRLDVLPTGRNFYSVDVRAIPTEVSYEIGKKSADLLINRYLQEEGEYPETVGLSVWGTSTMRTGGDDIGQAMALIGVEPVWQGISRRIIDFKVIPLFALKRPRVDVTLRISGFFRDAFPDIISLFNAVVKKVAMRDEPLDQNPIRKRYLKEKEGWMNEGLDRELAEAKALFRIFGAKPGAYGTGLQALIDERNWESKDDLANVYLSWSGYAYDAKNIGHSAHEVYQKRLGNLKVVMHNQDNREHDILDSDDYYQFHGGMANAARKESGTLPKMYFGDHALPENPKVKSLKEELLKVYRSRAVNPKWMERMREHGYKGAFEMLATVDYLFAYDATTGLIDDFMYEGMAEAYLLDDENKKFLATKNRWALHDMAERFLEAIQRNMWNADDETRQKLEELFIEVEE